MRRTAWCLATALALVVAARAAPLMGAEREASLRFVRELQNPDGGYRAAPAAGPSSVGATTSCLRAIQHFGGRAARPEDTVRFVLSCYNEGAGGFADSPGGTVDVRSTAMGLMALAEIETPIKERPEVQGAAAYLNKGAESLPDIYIAAAALDAVKLKAPEAARWTAAWAASRNTDGSYGKGPSDTAGALITQLRLGSRPGDTAASVRSLRAAQKPDGGFAAMGDASDLGTVYRIMRAFRMLNEKPDLERLRGFIARCRNADGGYGPSPGQPSSASATYFASIVLDWADELGRKP